MKSTVISLTVAVIAACGQLPDQRVEQNNNGNRDIAVDGECIVLTVGRWNADGPCIGMPMSTNVVAESSCGVSFTEWDMEMSVPRGAVLTGANVGFTGEGWDSCTGIVSDDGASIDANCPDSDVGPACSFTMQRS